MVWTYVGWLLVGILGFVLGAFLLQLLVALVLFLWFFVGGMLKNVVWEKIKEVFKRGN